MSKISVMLVDDATFIRDLVKKGLRRYFPEIQIIEATNGHEAQQLLTQQTVDLILCDWEMPIMSGLELLIWCRQQDNLKTTPFIMATSSNDEEDIVQATQAGASDYIGKPFSNEQLATKVKKALSRIGKLQGAQHSASAHDSPTAPTHGKAEVINPSTPAPTHSPAAAPVATTSSRSQLRLLTGGSMACVIKSLSLKEALLVVKRGEALPKVLENAVLSLEQRAANETACINGYLHAVAALEPNPDSEWLQLTFRFIEHDQQKLDHLSHLVTRSTAQKDSPGI